MLKAIEKLVKGISTHEGNHHSEDCGNIVKYYYFNTAICTQDIKSQTFAIDNGGYNTQSTNRAINDYRRWFTQHDYIEVFHKWYELRDMLESIPVGKQYRCRYYSTGCEITITKKEIPLSKDKLAEIVVSEELGECSTFTFTYRGKKSFNNEMLKVENHVI